VPQRAQAAPAVPALLSDLRTALSQPRDALLQRTNYAATSDAIRLPE
jgi:hypothetical protein